MRKLRPGIARVMKEKRVREEKDRELQRVMEVFAAHFASLFFKPTPLQIATRVNFR